MGDGLKQVLDYSDYLAAPADGQRYEILAGGLLVTPAPSPRHQRIVLRIAGRFREYFESRKCEVFVAPIDLILTDHDVLQPDLLVIDDPGLVTARGIEGPPLLVVEVLSPTTAGRDRGGQQGLRPNHGQPRLVPPAWPGDRRSAGRLPRLQSLRQR